MAEHDCGRGKRDNDPAGVPVSALAAIASVALAVAVALAALEALRALIVRRRP